MMWRVVWRCSLGIMRGEWHPGPVDWDYLKAAGMWIKRDPVAIETKREDLT